VAIATGKENKAHVIYVTGDENVPKAPGRVSVPQSLLWGPTAFGGPVLSASNEKGVGADTRGHWLLLKVCLKRLRPMVSLVCTSGRECRM
jgi:hypothetical protein